MRSGAALGAVIVTLVVLVSVPWWASRPEEPRLFLITPTRDNLMRYSHMLMLAYMLAASPSADQLVWIVVEDAPQRDPAVEQLLQDSGLAHEYLFHRTQSATVHRGVELRNAALDFLSSASRPARPGVVYFADDDNGYRPDLWPHLLKLPPDSFTIFAVGNVGYFGWEGPVLVPPPPLDDDAAHAASGDKRTALRAGAPASIEQWCCDACWRRWNVDMGGLAFHTSLLGRGASSDDAGADAGDAAPGPVRFDLSSRPGFLESDLLSQLEQQPGARFVVELDLVERVHVWHNLGKPFDRAGLYDADWTTEASVALRLRNESDVARGFAWAEQDLPRATILAS
ncbi:hypothetical protein JCM9279_004823 [Rhodotorula babjevae]